MKFKVGDRYYLPPDYSVLPEGDRLWVSGTIVDVIRIEYDSPYSEVASIICNVIDCHNKFYIGKERSFHEKSQVGKGMTPYTILAMI